MPFHYGWFDEHDGVKPPRFRAANDLTLTEWDLCLQAAGLQGDGLFEWSGLDLAKRCPPTSQIRSLMNLATYLGLLRPRGGPRRDASAGR